jgi:hypothetical protein
MRTLACIFAFVCLWTSAVAAQTDPPADSTADSLQALFYDSTINDSSSVLPATTIDDSILMVFPQLDLDTLSETQRMLAEHEARILLNRRDAAPMEIGENLSFFDSLAAYYASPRWNLREDIDRSFFHDAGDYFKSAPGFVVMEAQPEPFRKTVQPYSLMGNRLGVLADGRKLDPFEHVVEPDGLIDFNDIPTALDQTVAILPGPVGQIFGSGQAVATLLTLPQRPSDNEPHSAFIVDKGGQGYSYARGRYSKLFTEGREIDMSIGYRNSGVLGRTDKAYHYTAETLFPLGPSWQLRAEGRVYKRHADYLVRPSVSSARFERDRFDRAADLSLSRYNAERTSRTDFGYRHLRQGSAIVGDYHSNLNQTGHSLYMRRDWVAGRTILSAEVSADYLNYDNWHEQYDRYSGSARLSLARLSLPWGWALQLGDTYDETYKSLPSSALMIRREGGTSYLMVSLGYSERAPTLNELHLPFQKADIYEGDGGRNYADGGNEALLSEKQVIASAELALGGTSNNLSLSVAGGQIWDGIDWRTKDSVGMTVFTPVNGDLRFASAQAVARWQLWRAFAFKAGGGYNFTDYDLYDVRPYTPEYQAFGGGEVHIFWSQKLIDLWAYGELSYVGPYEGYAQKNLGDRVVVNTKLSFKMGNFRFHWVVQNSMLLEYEARDYFKTIERFTSYGFTWEFFD